MENAAPTHHRPSPAQGQHGTGESPISPWVWLPLLLAMTVAGAVIRAEPVVERPLWIDEAKTWLVVRDATAMDLVTWQHEHIHPPLSYPLIQATVWAVGHEQPWVLRLPALVCGILCIPAGFLLGRVAFGVPVGLLLAALVALDPNMVDQSQQARMYTPFALLMLLAMATAVPLLHGRWRGGWGWVVLGLLLGLAYATNVFGLMVTAELLSAALAVAIVGLVRRREGAGAMLAGAVVAGLVMAAVAQVGLVKMAGSTLGRVGERDPQGQVPSGLDALASTGREIIASASHLIGWTPAGLAFYLAAAVGLVLAARRRPLVVLALVLIGVFNILSLLVVRQAHSFIDPRYLTALQPAFWLGLAAIATGLCPRRGWRLAGMAVLAGYLILQAWQVLHIERWWQQPDRHLIVPQIQYVQERRQGDDAVIYHPRVMHMLGEYYGLAPDEALTRAVFDHTHLRPGPVLPEGFDAPRTWLIIGMVNYEGWLHSARRLVDVLAEHYALAGYDQTVQEALAIDRTVTVSISAEGMTFHLLDPGHPPRVLDWRPGAAGEP